MMLRQIAAVVAAAAIAAVVPTSAQVRLADESDRAAFRAWYVLLADAQFERKTADVNDCAALVRHAIREALRAHTPEWVRRSGLPFSPQFADVRSAPRAGAHGLPLFRVTADASPKYAEFADAKTLINLNARSLGRSTRAAQPGDLLYFHQPGQRPSTSLGTSPSASLAASQPDHLMVFIGTSHFETEGNDWVVYHTGPIDGGPGEVRKVRLATLNQHPAPRWRPLASNPSFVGVFRLTML